MNKIGIIGGAGPLASALLYKTLIEECYAFKSECPEIVLINYPFSRGLTLDEKKNNEEAIFSQLDYCLQFLVKNEVKVGLLACNTLHLFLKKFSSSIQFYHLPEVVLKEALEQKHRRLLILGTQNTCRSKLYQFSEMEIVTPTSNEDQRVVEKVIDRILKGKVEENDSALLSQVIENASLEQYLEGVILGCTDLSVLQDRFPIDSPIPLYDSIKIPAKIVARLVDGNLNQFCHADKQRSYL